MIHRGYLGRLKLALFKSYEWTSCNWKWLFWQNSAKCGTKVKCVLHTNNVVLPVTGCPLLVAHRWLLVAGSEAEEVMVVTEDYPNPALGQPIFRLGERLRVLSWYGPLVLIITPVKPPWYM